MSSGYLRLTRLAMDNFAQLMSQLITDSSALAVNVLDVEYQRSAAQTNETGGQFLQTAADMAVQARNASSQAQALVVALMVSFRGFMQFVIADFEAVATDYASRLRLESATRTQAAVYRGLQDRIRALQTVARLFDLGAVNLNRTATDPLDANSCAFMGTLCAISAQLELNVYVGTASGNSVYCEARDEAVQLVTLRGATADTTAYYGWPPYLSNFSAFKAACLSGYNHFYDLGTCDHGTAIVHPGCNGTCGFDPRCRSWYTVHNPFERPQTKMSDVYIDSFYNVAVVTLSYPLLSSSQPGLAGVVATDFYFSEVDDALGRLPSTGVSQLVAVVLNTSDLVVVGANRGCPNSSGGISGNPLADVCDVVLRRLSGWLAAHRALPRGASVELQGTLWDVLPTAQGGFSYFVAVGMNKTEVYAIIAAANRAAQETLPTVAQRQAARINASETLALSDMAALRATQVTNLQAKEAALSKHAADAHVLATQAFDDSRQQSAGRLGRLSEGELAAVGHLRDLHLAEVQRSVGSTFGSAVAIFGAILLAGAYGVWSVTRQVRNIALVVESVAHMQVEATEVAQKSSVQEVQQIQGALGVLVQRLACFKSYMPSGLFEHQALKSCASLPVLPVGVAARDSAALDCPADLSPPAPSPRHRATDACAATISAPPPMSLTTRLLRRSVAVMAVNLVGCPAALAHREEAGLEGLLNRLVATVHGLATKAQGHIDAVVGDQLLVTFNAHFACSDPCTAASTTALELVAALTDLPFAHVQVGLAAGPTYSGHVGYGPFKTMLALGAPPKVASMLAHLSGFDAPAVLVCPAVEERMKYGFALRPVDLVALPALGDHFTPYAKSITVFELQACLS
eukprot:EG_transcript_2744